MGSGIEIPAFPFAVASGAVALGLAAGLWALAERQGAQALRRALGRVSARARSALAVRDALLQDSGRPCLAWDASGGRLVSCGDAEALLRGCLEGPDGAAVSAALQALDRDGCAFDLEARGTGGQPLVVSGRPVGGATAVWLRAERRKLADDGGAPKQGLNTVPVVAPASEAISHAHLFDRLKTALALFDTDRRLQAYNAAFVALWGMPQAWLDGRPTHDALLDRLREARKLPEQRDFQAWKRNHLALYRSGQGATEDSWTLPNGHILAVTMSATPEGGIAILFEDVSEKFALESTLKTQLATQAATLDVLSEAVGAFGPDGRLTLHNAAFAEIWSLDRAVLAERPHIRAIAELCLAKFGDEAMWDRLVATVSSSPAQRRHWRKIHRTDGTVLSLSTVPLPNRATLVTFTDVTDAFGIGAALQDRHEALALVDRLRTDYIKQLSYELRTPLNTVMGYAEQLASAPAMSPTQREQVDAVLAGARALKDVADTMLAGLVDARDFARLPDRKVTSHESDGMQQDGRRPSSRHGI